MAAINISARIDALDILSEARGVAAFIQGITLAGGDLHLGAGQVAGLYCTLQDLIDRIRRAEDLVGQIEFTEKPENETHAAEQDGAQS